MTKLTLKSPPLRRTIRALAATAWLMILMSSTGCRAPRIIAADQTVLRVEAARPFTAPCDGWFLSDALYQRTRRAVADRILELRLAVPANQAAQP